MQPGEENLPAHPGHDPASRPVAGASSLAVAIPPGKTLFAIVVKQWPRFLVLQRERLLPLSCHGVRYKEQTGIAMHCPYLVKAKVWE
jgi:hypothetical protein